MKIAFERCYPYVGSLLPVYPVCHYLTSVEKLGVVVDLINPLLGMVAISIGALVASLSVLLTAQEMSPIKRLKTTYHFKELIRYHGEGLVTGLICCVLSLVALVLCKQTDKAGAVIFSNASYSAPLFVAWIIATSCALLTFFRVARILTRMVFQSVADKPNRFAVRPPLSPAVTDTVEITDSKKLMKSAST